MPNQKQQPSNTIGSTLFCMSRVVSFLFLPLLLFVPGSTIASDSTSENDFSNYVVSWSGDNLIATIDTHESAPVHRVFFIETAHPDQKTAIGGDYDGKGFAGVYFSADEKWLCVNVGIGVHGAECHVFKHGAERRFEELTTPDINATAKSLFETAAGPEFTFDAVYGLYWSGETLVLMASGRGQKNDKIYTDEMFLEYRLAKAEVVPVSKHFVAPIGTGAGANPDPEYERWDNASLEAYEQSLQHQLNVIYNLLLTKLDADAKAKLASEQNQWELTRQKKPPGRHERDLFVQQRINALAARFLALR
ncbi:MAG: hypothetical protein JOZ08_26535 [Verrucomicrobia bacterium]|nr:hypothetical protein [Verrucomicrobiota bacterium]